MSCATSTTSSNYIGAARDSDQRRARATWLSASRGATCSRRARPPWCSGSAGGYQLLGHSYELGEKKIPGIGLLDARTVRSKGASDPATWPGVPAAEGVIAGFENHAGRTELLAGQEPLGRSCAGTETTAQAGSRARGATT